LPVVPPIEIEADALAQLVFVNLALHPLVEDVLVAREDGFEAENNGPACLAESLDHLGGKFLRCGQRVVVADQDGLRPGNALLQLLGRQHRLIGTEGFVEVPEVFAAAIGSGGADLALYLSQRVKLGSAATPS